MRRDVDHYNLDAIISVGYRVNSVRATQFRQWATSVLHDFAIKGWALDRKRLENGALLGHDYFERLLEEIREIRLSERRFYQKVTDVYATAIDYNPQAPTSRQFFATVQNKLHFAIHGHTAAELIRERADADQAHMGLSTWERAPRGKVARSERESQNQEWTALTNAICTDWNDTVVECALSRSISPAMIADYQPA